MRHLYAVAHESYPGVRLVAASRIGQAQWDYPAAKCIAPLGVGSAFVIDGSGPYEVVGEDRTGAVISGPRGELLHPADVHQQFGEVL